MAIDYGLNEHGVFTNPEITVLVQNPNYNLSFSLAQHEGIWKYGINCDCGGSRVGAGGTSFLPGLRDPGFKDKAECIDQTKERIRAFLKNKIKHCFGSEEPVRDLAMKALAYVPQSEQLSLF